MKKCIKCNEEIHPRRVKCLPNTKTCVKCSTTGTYKAVVTTGGEGDHTWNDIKLMSDDEFNKHQEMESKLFKK